MDKQNPNNKQTVANQDPNMNLQQTMIKINDKLIIDCSKPVQPQVVLSIVDEYKKINIAYREQIQTIDVLKNKINQLANIENKFNQVVKDNQQLVQINNSLQNNLTAITTENQKLLAEIDSYKKNGLIAINANGQIGNKDSNSGGNISSQVVEEFKRKITLLLEENGKLNQALLQNAKIGANYNELQKEYMRLKQEMEEMQNSQMQNSSNEMVNDLTEKLDLLLADNENLNKTLQTKAIEFEELKKQQVLKVNELQKQIQKVSNENQDLIQQLKINSSKMEEYEKSMQKYQDDLQKYQIDNKKYQAEIKKYQDGVSKLEEVRDSIQTENANLRQEMESVVTELHNLEQEIERLKNEQVIAESKQIENLKKLVTDKVKEIEGLKIELQQKDQTCQNLEAEISKIKQIQEKLRLDHDSLKSKHSVLEKQSSVHQNIKVEKEKMSVDLKEKSQMMETQASQIKQLNDEIMNYQKIISSLKEENNRLSIGYNHFKKSDDIMHDIEIKIGELASENEMLNLKLNDKMKEIESLKIQFKQDNDMQSTIMRNEIDRMNYLLEDKIREFEAYKVQYSINFTNNTEYEKQLGALRIESDRLNYIINEKNNEIESYKYRVSALEAKVANYFELENQVSYYRGENEKKTLEINDLHTKIHTIEGYSTKIAETDARVNNLLSERENILRELTTYKIELENARSKLLIIDNLEMRIRDQENEIRRLDLLNKERATEIETWRGKSYSLETFQFKVHELEDRIHILTTERDNLKKNYETIRGSNYRLADLEATSTMYLTEKERLTRELTEKTEEVETLRKALDQVSELEDQIAQLSEENDKIVKDLELKEEEIQKYKTKLEKASELDARFDRERKTFQEELEDWKLRVNKYENSHYKVKELEKQLRQEKEINEVLTDSIESKGNEIEKLKKKLRDLERLQSKMSEAEEKSKNLFSENELIKLEIDEKKQELELLRTKYLKLEKRTAKYSEIELKYNTLREEFQDLKLDFDTKIREIHEASEEKLHELERELNFYKDEKSKWEASNIQVNEQVINFQKKIEELEAKYKTENVKCASLNAQIISLTNEIQVHLTEIDRLNVDNTRLLQSIAGLTRERDNLLVDLNNKIYELENHRILREHTEKSHAAKSTAVSSHNEKALEMKLNDLQASYNYLFSENERLKVQLSQREVPNVVYSVSDQTEINRLVELLNMRDREIEDLKGRLATNLGYDLSVNKAIFDENNNLKLTIEELKREIDRLKVYEITSMALGDLKSQVNALQTENYNLKIQIDQAKYNKFNVDELNMAKLQELEISLQMLSSENDKLNKIILDGSNQIEILNRQIITLEAENKNLKAENEWLRKKITESRGETLEKQTATVLMRNIQSPKNYSRPSQHDNMTDSSQRLSYNNINIGDDIKKSYVDVTYNTQKIKNDVNDRILGLSGYSESYNLSNPKSSTSVGRYNFSILPK